MDAIVGTWLKKLASAHSRLWTKYNVQRSSSVLASLFKNAYFLQSVGQQVFGAPTDRIISKFSALNRHLKMTLRRILTIRTEVMTQTRMMGTTMIKIVTQVQTRTQTRMDKMDNNHTKKKRMCMTLWHYLEMMDKNII